MTSSFNASNFVIKYSLTSNDDQDMKPTINLTNKPAKPDISDTPTVHNQDINNKLSNYNSSSDATTLENKINSMSASMLKNSSISLSSSSNAQLTTSLTSQLNYIKTTLSSLKLSYNKDNVTKLQNQIKNFYNTYKSYMNDGERNSTNLPTKTNSTTQSKPIQRSNATTLSDEISKIKTSIAGLNKNTMVLGNGVSQITSFIVGKSDTNQTSATDPLAEIKSKISELETQLLTSTGSSSMLIVSQLSSLKANEQSIISSTSKTKKTTTTALNLSKNSETIKAELNSLKSSGQPINLSLTGKVSSTVPIYFEQSRGDKRKTKTKKTANQQSVETQSLITSLETLMEQFKKAYSSKVLDGTVTSLDTQQYTEQLTQLATQINNLKGNKTSSTVSSKTKTTNTNPFSNFFYNYGYVRLFNKTSIDNLQDTMRPLYVTDSSVDDPEPTTGTQSNLSVETSQVDENNISMKFSGSLSDSSFSGTVNFPVGTLRYLGSEFLNELKTKSPDVRSNISNSAGGSFKYQLTDEDMWTLFVVFITSFIAISFTYLKNEDGTSTNLSNYSADELLTSDNITTLTNSLKSKSKNTQNVDDGKIMTVAGGGKIVSTIMKKINPENSVSSSLADII